MSDNNYAGIPSKMTSLGAIGLAVLLILAIIVPAANVYGDTVNVSIVKGASSKGTSAYSPNPVSIELDDTVTWKNDDSTTHTVTSGSDGTSDDKFDSSLLGRGKTFSHTFTEEGEYPYFCNLHPNMVAKVVVGEEESSEITGTVSISQEGTATLKSKASGFEKGTYEITIEISGDYSFADEATIDEESLEGLLLLYSIADDAEEEFPLEDLNLKFAKDIKSVSYSAEVDGSMGIGGTPISGTLSGTIKFSEAIDFENGIDQSSLPAGKNSMKAKVGKASFDTKKTSTGEISFGEGTGGEDVNTAPVADAGEDQSVDEGNEVTLDGTNSFDDDDDSLTYSWTQTDGTEVELSDTSSEEPTFTAPDVDEETTLTFELIVNDGTEDSEPDTVDIVVEPIISGSFTINQEGTATLTSAKGDFEAGDYLVSVEINGDFEIENNKLTIDSDSLSGSISIGDHTHDLDVTKFTVSKDKKTVTYSAKLVGMSGSVTGTMKFATAIDFEGAVDQDAFSADKKKNSLSATMEKVKFDTKKTSTGSIGFE